MSESTWHTLTGGTWHTRQSGPPHATRHVNGVWGVDRYGAFPGDGPGQFPARPGGAESEYVTLAGADWLASASSFPRSVQALWSARPTAPSVLPCGTAFDVVNLPALFGRRVLDRLWASGPGCGPVAAHRGRTLLFTAPGTADRLPALLAWEEWGAGVPPMLCHGLGDAVTVPPLVPPASDTDRGRARWLVAPDTRHPWLPGADVLLWACLRASRSDARVAADPT